MSNFDFRNLPPKLDRCLNQQIDEGITVQVTSGFDTTIFILEVNENWYTIIEWYGGKDEDSWNPVNIAGQSLTLLRKLINEE